MNRFFAPGLEFSRIERMFSAEHFARDGRGLGDDAGIWEPVPGKTWVAASDASVEGVHYRLDWAPPESALRKALLANLSDINAMGGRTRFVLFNLGARTTWTPEVFEALGAALREVEAEAGCRVAGGDTVLLADKGFFSFAVWGEVAGKPLLRSAVRPGHRVYVSGVLGGSSAGLSLLQEGGSRGNSGAAEQASSSSESALLQAHFRPEPPLELGPLLATLCRDDRPVAAIDISDGLSSELWHLARQSQCALHIDAAKLPVHAALRGRPFSELRSHVLHGGEEYQLLFTGDFSPEELVRIRAHVPVSEIGAAKTGEGVFLSEGTETLPLPAGGYVHD